jgi:intraflagellar transport protein 52
LAAAQQQPQQPQQQQPQAAADASAPRVLFSCCKGETHTHRSGFKQLFRRLRSAYRPDKLDSRDDLHPEVLLGPGSAAPAILVLGCPTQRFSAAECDAISGLVRGGGGLMVLLAEGGEAAAGTNINYVLEQFGVAANADAVLRTSHYKYMHPKEALVVDGVLNRSLLLGAGGGGGSGSSKGTPAAVARQRQQDAASGPVQPGGLEFVYPHGCTLTVQAPAVPLLSSGRICYPMQRPLAAGWEAPAGSGGGRLLVLGSCRLFDDRWLDKEANARLMDWAFKWLRPVRGWGGGPCGRAGLGCTGLGCAGLGWVVLG